MATIVHELDFQCVKDAFHDHVVPAVPLATHRAVDAIRGEQPLVVCGRVLDGAIGVTLNAPFNLFSTTSRQCENFVVARHLRALFARICAARISRATRFSPTR
jgi:hypothetical protein